ncbi:hypothetical protein SUGI_1066080 [Cryptomeria japonica]|nr:hypothetical protein SUGI_1066080 [Cryptomeria japonica]
MHEDKNVLESLNISLQTLGAGINKVIVDSNDDTIPTCEEKSEQKPLVWEDLQGQLMVMENKIAQALSRVDLTHKHLEDLIWMAQREERQNGSVDEEPKILIWDSSSLTPCSLEFAAFTCGITNEEGFTSVSTQSTSVVHKDFNEEVLVKVEDMTQRDDSSSTISYSHEFVVYSHEEGNEIYSIIADNPLFKMSADLTLDNPLFELDDEDALDLDDTNDMWDSSVEYNCKTKHTLSGPATNI